MPALTDPRWETACQLRAKGVEIMASYQQAGFGGKPANATRFFKRTEIRNRVMEIQDDRFKSERKVTEIAVKKAGLDESWIIERTKYAIEIALRGEPLVDAEGRPTGKYGKRNIKAAIDGLRLASDFKGMRIQRLELGGPGDFARMSDEELDEALIIEGEALGIPKEAIQKALLLKGPDSSES